MEGSDNDRFPKLKELRVMESSALKAKGLWWVTSGKLEKPKIPESNASTAAKEEYATATHHWEDRNDRVNGMITLSIEQGPRVHIVKIEDVTKMWSTLKTQYEQSDLTTLYLATKELTQSKQSDCKSHTGLC